MEFYIISAIAIAVLIGAVLNHAHQTKQKEEIEKSIIATHPQAKVYVSHVDLSYLAVDFETEKLLVGLRAKRDGLPTPEEVYQRVYGFQKISEVSLLKDGVTITSTNRGSQALGATVGGVAFGGIGALIGGLSGSTTSQDRVRRVALRIKVDDPDHPVHEVTMFNWEGDKKGVKADGFIIQNALKEAEEFMAHVSNAIRRTKESSRWLKTTHSLSRPDHLRELWQLKNEGIISEEEFQAEKAKVLSSASSCENSDSFRETT